MKNIIIATLVTLLTISSLYQMNLDSDSDFEKWTLKYGKKFYGDEKIYRQTIYYQNKKMIEEHNSRNDVTYQMRENQFMSITNEEFIKLYLNQKLPQAQNYQNYVSRNSILDNQEQNIQLRGEIDWRGVVTVKNQGQCGSSWAVAASSVVEADFAIKQNIKVILSPQEIMDCAPGFYYDACANEGHSNTAEIAINYIYIHMEYTLNRNIHITVKELSLAIGDHLEIGKFIITSKQKQLVIRSHKHLLYIHLKFKLMLLYGNFMVLVYFLIVVIDQKMQIILLQQQAKAMLVRRNGGMFKLLLEAIGESLDLQDQHQEILVVLKIMLGLWTLFDKSQKQIIKHFIFSMIQILLLQDHYFVSFVLCIYIISLFKHQKYIIYL